MTLNAHITLIDPAVTWRTVKAAEELDELIDAIQQLPDKQRLIEIYYDGPGIYDGARLTVGIDRQRGVGVVTYHGYDSFISQGATPANPDTLIDGELLYQTDTEPVEFPTDAEVPQATVLESIREFYEADGGLPAVVSWSDDAP